MMWAACCARSRGRVRIAPRGRGAARRCSVAHRARTDPARMAPISPADGPVAVTGASGYIGSWVTKNLAENGYTVRACVRDATREDRTAHLRAINETATGEVQLYTADMLNERDYDPIFDGCSAVFHVAANFGTDPRWAANTNVVGRLSPIDEAAAAVLDTEAPEPTTSYDQGVYDSLVVATERILGAIERSGSSVKRLVYTSSFAAVSGPRPDGHVISEADWAGAGPYVSEEHMMEKHNGHWTAEDNAYGMCTRARVCPVASWNAAAQCVCVPLLACCAALNYWVSAAAQARERPTVRS